MFAIVNTQPSIMIEEEDWDRESIKGGATQLDEFSEMFQTAVDPQPHSSEWSLSLEIMCMHFILSGHHTSLHICNHINQK